MIISPLEWQEWVQNPVTKEFFEFLNRSREKIKEEWALSIYTGASDVETLQRNAAAIGQVNLLKELVEIEFERLEESKDE